MKKGESAWPAWHSDYSEQEKPLPENHAAQLRRLQRMNSWYYTKHDMIGDMPYEEMDCEDMYTSGYETVTSENWISRLMERIFGIGMPEQMHA